MPDVLKIATERRDALRKEIVALDRFIEMAHALLAREADKQKADVTTPPVTGKLKPLPATSGPSKASSSESETEAFLKARDIKVERPSAVSTRTSHQGLANLARN